MAMVIKCSKGRVQVIKCDAWRKNEPFPTNFWLICPYLVYLAGRVESEGGVKELEKYIEEKGLSKKYYEYNRLHAELRLKRLGAVRNKFYSKYAPKKYRKLMSTGIGGIKYNKETVRVKCLHLQLSSLIGTGKHPAKEWFKSKGLICECENICKR